MNEKAAIMNKEIRAVAYHRALIISKWFLSSTLLIMALYLGIRRFPVSPLYILLFLNILPPIFSFAANDYGKKKQYKMNGQANSLVMNKILQDIIKDDPFLLGTLKRKYKYTKLRYVSNSASYLISLILIGLWQYNYNQQYYLPDYLQMIPILLLGSSIMIRLLGIVFYQLKLRYDLTHNKVR